MLKFQLFAPLKALILYESGKLFVKGLGIGI
jgi:hypothetical protein